MHTARSIGSSPLARGLRRRSGRHRRPTRIIPARAGFTSPPRWPGPRPPDHPRSRGVYASALPVDSSVSGSSPLARGLPSTSIRRAVACGIIPARAGFTRELTMKSSRGGDHPRSRGVYSSQTRLSPPATGSSPLARGLLVCDVAHVPAGRIIPARAGFTARPPPPHPQPTDHPRSRGVYTITWEDDGQWGGSSPLARGLPGRRRMGGRRTRIIPARAGFTRPCPWLRCEAADHPRSRGVYYEREGKKPDMPGSSPLARGLPPAVGFAILWCGIIPARAGFTHSPLPMLTGGRDHPRSRGVYTCGSLESQRWPTLSDRFYLHW